MRVYIDSSGNVIRPQVASFGRAPTALAVLSGLNRCAQGFGCLNGVKSQARAEADLNNLIQSAARRAQFGGVGFGDGSPSIPPGMPDAPAWVLAQLIQAYVQGTVSANLVPEQFEGDMLNIASMGAIPSEWFAQALGNSGAAAAIANLKLDGGYIQQLATTLAYQAWNGQRADGSPYTWDDWTSFANNVGSDIATQTGAAWDSDTILATMRAAKATLDQLAATVKNPLSPPSLLPGWVLPAALLFGAAYAYNTFAAPVSGAYRAGRAAYQAGRKLGGPIAYHPKITKPVWWRYLVPAGIVYIIAKSLPAAPAATPAGPYDVPPGIQPAGYNPKTDPTNPAYDPTAV